MRSAVAFGSGGETLISPVILLLLLLGVAAILSLPRKYVAPPLLFCILVPLGQVLMIGSFHFQVFRVLIFACAIRLLWQRYVSEGARSRIRFNAVDKAIIAFGLSCAVSFGLLWQDGMAFVDALGETYNILGLYFVFRFFIRDRTDIERLIKVLALVATIVAIGMFNEQRTGNNFFGIFGGVPQHTAIRDGYLRSQGPFLVYITAGVFGAALLPLFVCLWRSARFVAIVGIIASLVITLTSHTSTAISACVATLLGIAMWPLRRKMGLIRRFLAVALVTLHLVMKAPVWALIARVDFVGGSTGYHRFQIIDNCIHHFWDWCLVGARDYMHWGSEDDMWDLANQYVWVAETHGLFTLICFIVFVVYCFKYVGVARKAVVSNKGSEWFIWLMGVALFVNLIAFIGVSYFDQISVFWYALLAMIIAATRPSSAPSEHKSLKALHDHIRLQVIQKDTFPELTRRIN